MRFALPAGLIGAGLLAALSPVHAETRVSFDFIAVEQEERTCITATADSARMCVTGVLAGIDNPNCWLNSLEANGTIVYNKHRRRDRIEDRKSATGGEGIHNLRVDIDYGGVPQGGRVELEVRAEAACPGDWRKTYRRFVTGTHTALNPDSEAVRNALKLLPLQVVVYTDSKFRMFDDRHWPIFENGGFGIGRLKQPSARAIWDWRANVGEVIARYGNVMERARAYPEQMREKTGRKLPNFDKQQLLAEFYQQWKGGHYWVPHESESRWVRTGKADYGQAALKLDNEIRAGKFPEGW